ncbi:hypothetical protein Hanom_Chr12g01118321 [Helianthus anomalus]
MASQTTGDDDEDEDDDDLGFRFAKPTSFGSKSNGNGSGSAFSGVSFARPNRSPSPAVSQQVNAICSLVGSPNC